MGDIVNKRGTVHIDKYLTNMSIAYSSQRDEFIFNKIFPALPTGKQSDKYIIYDDGAGRRIENDIHAPRTVPNSIDSWKFSSDSYYCDPHALSDDYTPEEEKNYDVPLDVAKDTMEGVLENIMINKESNAATLAFTAGNYTNTAAAPTKWDADDGSAVDPRIQVNTALSTIKKASGMIANTIVFNYETYLALRNNAYVGSYLSDAADKDVNLRKLAAFFKVKQVFLASATYTSSKEGLTNTQAYVWTDNVLVCFVSPTPARKKPSLGYTYQWNPYGAGTMFVEKHVSKRPKVTYIDVYDHYDQVLSFEKSGYLITDVLT